MVSTRRTTTESRFSQDGFAQGLSNTSTCDRLQELSLENACWSAKVCDDYRGQNTVVLDLREVTPEFDYFVITTGNSRRQMHAIAEEVDRVLAERGTRRLGIEGYDRSQWIVQDYGDIVLHVFTEATRDLYDLEHLWGDALPIDWQAVLAETQVA